MQPTQITDTLENNWFSELKHHPNNPSLVRATLRTLGWTPFLIGILIFLNGLAMISQGLLLTFLMKYFEPCSSMLSWHAWSFAIGIILITLLSILIIHTVCFF